MWQLSHHTGTPRKWDLTVQEQIWHVRGWGGGVQLGPYCTGTSPLGHVQTCSLWSTHGWQEGGSHSTGMLSCIEAILKLIQWASTLHLDIRTLHEKNSAVPLWREVRRRDDHVVHCLHENRHLPAAGWLEDPLQHLESVLQHVTWTHVDLRHHYKHGDIKRQRQTQVLLSHTDHSCVSTHLRIAEQVLCYQLVRVHLHLAKAIFLFDLCCYSMWTGNGIF